MKLDETVSSALCNIIKVDKTVNFVLTHLIVIVNYIYAIQNVIDELKLQVLLSCLYSYVFKVYINKCHG